MSDHGLRCTDGVIKQVSLIFPPNAVKQEVTAMMMESKRTAFELWLREYGSHLEQLARAETMRGAEEQSSRESQASARDLNDPSHHE